MTTWYGTLCNMIRVADLYSLFIYESGTSISKKF